MHSLLKYKLLQLTFKISLCRLLHVSVRSDHHQGTYAEPCYSYSICGIISKITLLIYCCVVAVCVSGCSVCTRRCAACHTQATLARLSVNSLRKVQMDRNMYERI
jgi:hypothetical protein